MMIAAFVSILWLGVPGASQMPALAKLIVRSIPKSAAIMVNGQKTGQFTDAQFVVRPGSYRVSVSSTAPGGANCSESPSISLNAGDARTLICNGGKWQ
jgi:hypothetical protein